MREDQVVRQQQRAERDARIRNIEGWPMILAGVQLDEIDHESQAHSISQISGDARQKQRARAQNSIIIARGAKEIKQHRDRSRSRQDYEKPPPKGAAFLQLTERDASIFRVSEIQQAADDCAVFKAHAMNSPGFARLVRQVNAKRRDQVSDAPCETIVQLASISSNAATHLSHTVGNFEDSPTRVE